MKFKVTGEGPCAILAIIARVPITDFIHWNLKTIKSNLTNANVSQFKIKSESPEIEVEWKPAIPRNYLTAISTISDQNYKDVVVHDIQDVNHNITSEAIASLTPFDKKRLQFQQNEWANLHAWGVKMLL